MSDLEKVYNYAVKLGVNTPIQLRWEGAGDCAHAAKLLSSLKHKHYPKTDKVIKFHAVINIYEKDDDPIVKTAKEVLAFAFGWGTAAGQTYAIKTGADVQRDSGSFGQNKAHIMFVRNIMPTDELGNSLTDAKDTLETIHLNGLRGRANSLESGGQLRLGMSGAPGLISDSAENRLKSPVTTLFVNAPKLVSAAKEAELAIVGGPNRLGSEDYDEGGVMKNNGTDLGIKKTFYLTFVR
jgi:hypothetical protein